MITVVLTCHLAYGALFIPTEEWRVKSIQVHHGDHSITYTAPSSEGIPKQNSAGKIGASLTLEKVIRPGETIRIPKGCDESKFDVK